MKLTTPMRNALEQAQHAPLRRVHNPTTPGKPPWPAHPSTLHALARHDLVTVDQIRNRHGYPTQLWTITDTGRQALQPKETFRQQRPVYLARPTKNSGDYTNDPSRRIDPLPVLDEASPEWRRRAATRYADAADHRTEARRLARNIRAA